jgi:hypothetical protein
MSRRTVKLALALALAASAMACSRPKPPAAGPNDPVEKVYDRKTGRLTLLTYDTNRDGRIDTWCRMDGTRVVRVEADRDGDGKVDRWEYYSGDGQKVEKIGLSRLKDGEEDAWAYPAPDGSLLRMEISTNRDGKVTRIEHYEKGVLARAEEDGDGDGRPDKWETYGPGGRLASVELDTRHRGTPDRRLVYLPGGDVKAETIK